MNLVIVESPTKARTLSRFLSKDYEITSSMGHIRDLPENKLGVDIAHDFKPEYVLVKGRKQQVEELKELVGKADRVILATDPDREGEAIAYHIMEVMRSNTKQKKTLLNKTSGKPAKWERVAFHEITEGAIKEALSHPREINMPLVEAQQARRLLDRLVGYKLSPLLWYKIRKGLSAGRVQSVAVRLIVEREREIEAFKPVEYWIIEAELAKQLTTHNSQLTTLVAKLIEKDGQKIEVKIQDQANQIVSDLQKATYTVSSVEKKEVRRQPYPPFITSTLQQAAANRYGWSAKKTMQLAQMLYERGHITYHRTDSTNIAAEAIGMARDFITKAWGVTYVPPEARIYKTKSKVAQEAHEAIRPTNIWSASDVNISQVTLISLPSDLGRDACRLYGLIWRRFVACQMAEAIYDQTSVTIQADAYTLRASGSITKFKGWQVVDEEVQSAKRKIQSQAESGDGVDEHQLPNLTEQELLDLLQLLPQQKFTEPPPRYNEASLIKALEEKGIGRPSTYAPTISTILERHYVEKLDRKLEPTPLGIAVNDFLVANFANIVDYDFTARMEDDLDNIANGEISWVPLLQEFYHPFSNRLATVYKEAQRVKIATEEIDERCPTCGNPLVVRIGKYGKFVACSTYPTCTFTKQYIEKAGVPCPLCGGDVILRKTKQGKVFYGCSNYPKCTFASWTKPKVESGSMNKEDS